MAGNLRRSLNVDPMQSKTESVILALFYQLEVIMPLDSLANMGLSGEWRFAPVVPMEINSTAVGGQKIIYNSVTICNCGGGLRCVLFPDEPHIRFVGKHHGVIWDEPRELACVCDVQPRSKPLHAYSSNYRQEPQSENRYG